MNAEKSVEFLWRAVPHDFLDAEDDGQIGNEGRRHGGHRREGGLPGDIVREMVRENVCGQDGEEEVGKRRHDGRRTRKKRTRGNY